jgi:hypothetical protein
MAEPVFYSFHYDNDVNRVQLVRQMGVIEGDEPVRPNEWESIKAKGNAAVEKWIDDNMRYKTCVVVLIGTETAARPWVKLEIKRAWEMKKGLLGIHIHNLKCMRRRMRTRAVCSKGSNHATRRLMGRFRRTASGTNESPETKFQFLSESFANTPSLSALTASCWSKEYSPGLSPGARPYKIAAPLSCQANRHTASVVRSNTSGRVVGADVSTSRCAEWAYRHSIQDASSASSCLDS